MKALLVVLLVLVVLAVVAVVRRRRPGPALERRPSQAQGGHDQVDPDSRQGDGRFG